MARLEDDLGIDPFTISDAASFPTTVGDFIWAYENVPREIFALHDHSNCSQKVLVDRRGGIIKIAGLEVERSPSIGAPRYACPESVDGQIRARITATIVNEPLLRPVL